MTNELSIANRLNDDLAVFRVRFWRSHRLLHSIACRVLGGPERADDAIENCWVKASRNPPRFEYEGAFRSWLARVLIDEALAILREDRQAVKPAVSSELIPGNVFRRDDLCDEERRIQVVEQERTAEFRL
jgi:RNA polymerase sigma-70 factor, ECF subfamily